jgi:hypothetical protein
MLRCLDRRCESTLHTPCAGLIALSCELTFISYARSAGGGRYVLPKLLHEHDVVQLAREQPLLLKEELICKRSAVAVAVAATMARARRRTAAANSHCVLSGSRHNGSCTTLG